MASQLVDKTIDDEELCVHCIHHPLMYSASKNKLKEEAFQPKWDERDAYTSSDLNGEDIRLVNGYRLRVKDLRGENSKSPKGSKSSKGLMTDKERLQG